MFETVQIAELMARDTTHSRWPLVAAYRY